MPNLSAIYRHVLDEARRRFVEGESVEAIATDLELSPNIVTKYTAHLPQKNAKREARRLAILGCLDAGFDVRGAAKEVGCEISTVVRFIRSERAEEQSGVEKRAEEYQAERAAEKKFADAEKKRAVDDARAAKEAQAKTA